MLRGMRWIALVVMVSTWFAPAPLLAEDKADTQARDASEQFMKAAFSKDLASLAKLVDVPWFHDGKQIVREREEVKKQFEQLFAKKEFVDLSFTIKMIVAYHQVRDKTNAEERKLLDEVLTKEDRVVLISIKSAKKEGESIVLMVRLRDGGAKVVGFRD